MAKQIHLGKYPYVATRVKAMKSLLIKKADYHKLLKMELAEIAAFLQQTNYKKEISELGLKHADAELIERALNKNLANTTHKLMKMMIAYPELRLVIGTYLRRLDIYNIKQIIRGKFAQVSEEEIIGSLIPNGGLSYALLREFVKKDSLFEVVSQLDSSDEMKAAVKRFEETKNLQTIENILDLHYYAKVEKVAKRIKGDELLERHLKEEIDVINVKLLLRFKKQHVPFKEILAHIHTYGKDLTKPRVEELAGKSFEDLLRDLQKTKLGRIVADDLQEAMEAQSLVAVETALDKVLMQKSSLFLRQKPLSINPLIGFLISKDIEVRNIRMITRAKQHRLPEEFMEKQLLA